MDFKEIKFSVKIRDIPKIVEKNCISAFGYENKAKFSIYVSKNTFKRHFDSLLIEKQANLALFLSKILTLSCTTKHYIAT